MSGTEIKNLRDQGKLEEALAMAISEFKMNPDNEWTKRNLAWVYDAYCKKASEAGDVETFKDYFSKLIELDILSNPKETFLNNTLCWRFMKLFINAVVPKNQVTTFCDEMFELAKMLHPEIPSEQYSILFKAFYKFKEDWNNFNAFCDWWKFDNFREEDYKCDVLSNGRKMPISLVEGAYIAYAKHLIAGRNKNAIMEFIPKLQELSEKHPEMLYPSYYVGKLMISTNSDKKAVFDVLLPFARKKRNDFWVWQLLADTQKEAKDKYLACLLRAVNCQTEEQFLVNVYFILTSEFIRRKEYANAKLYFNRYLHGKELQGAPIAPLACEIKKRFNSQWKKESEKEPFCDIDYVSITNEILFGDIPERNAVVTFVNRDKKMATVLYGIKKEGFFKYDKLLSNIHVGDVLNIRVSEVSSDGRMDVFSARIMMDFEDTDYYKKVEGVVSSNNSQTAFFINVQNDSYYIPMSLLEKKKPMIGEMISGIAVYGYNKNKDDWGWKCVKIKKNPEIQR